MLLLVSFAFLAGIVTILSPCILPILPIVLSGTVGGGKRKPLGIITGFVGGFTLFTLFLTKIIQLTGISVDGLRIIAAIIILLFGISFLIPAFQLFIEKLFSKIAHPVKNTSTGFFGGVAIGLSTGLVWSPCVGPIMASVIALAASSQVTATTVLITFVYGLGSAIPMLCIMYGGRKLLSKVPALLSQTGNIQKGFGILMIVFAIALLFGLDRNFEAYIATTPYGANLTNLENTKAVHQELDALKHTASISVDENSLLNANTPAPDFVGITKWLNLSTTLKTNSPDSLSIKELRGKVVLVDFWTYTCINCIRTLPFVTSWYDKYNTDGFVVIGVHTPEFAFEHDSQNVVDAISRYHIHYPVAQDNNYATWNAFQNQYWPAEYLIDAKGNIRRVEFGEGNYDKMEMAIQLLLNDAGKKVTTQLDAMHDQTPTAQISPETYLGASRMQYYYPTGNLSTGTQALTLSDALPQNSFEFGGTWTITQEFATAEENAALNYNFVASKVYIILRPPTGDNGQVKVSMDGKVIDPSVAGSDVQNGIVTVDSDRLYNIIDLHGKTESHILKLEFLTPGIQAYTFTFG